jgi:Ca-activated chloride channel family protein
MIWNNSVFLWLLLLLPAIGGFYYWYGKKQQKKLQQYFSERLVNQLRRNFWMTGDKIRLFCMLAAMLLFIIALAGPKIGTEVREVQRIGVNMMIALDLSRSMNTQDVNPSRLEKAKFEINRLVNRLQGDRVGLLVFTDEAFLQVPLTTDYSAFRMLLDISNTEQMPSSGTNFSAAMITAKEAFESIDDQNNNAANVLLFVADGENHSGSFSSAMDELQESNVTVFSIGVGTSGGGPVPVFNENGEMIGYHRDSSGQTITSRLGSDTMRQIAGEGGGEYYEISSGSDNIEAFFSNLDELERGEFSSQEFADYKDQYQVLLIPGIILFLIALFFPQFKPNFINRPSLSTNS